MNDNDPRKPKDVKKLLTSVFSTSSLSKSLQKLSDLSRSSSPQNKSLKVIQGPRLSNSGSVSRLQTNSTNRSLNGSQVMRHSQIDSSM